MIPHRLSLNIETSTQKRKAAQWHEYLRWCILAPRSGLAESRELWPWKTGLPITLSNLLFPLEMSVLCLSLSIYTECGCAIIS